KSIRDVTFGFLIATIFWTIPKLIEVINHQAYDGNPPVDNESSDPLFPSGSEIGFQGPTSYGSEPFVAVTAPKSPEFQSYFPISFDPIRSWGYLSPFHSLPSNTFGLSSSSPQVPKTCKLKQVHMLHRHGARYPTSSKEPADFAKRIKSTKSFNAKGNLQFLNNWNYSLGVEILTPFGRSQLFNLGVGFREKYGHLLDRIKDAKKLVFRTTSQHRMLHSALNFAAGKYFLRPFTESIIIEAPKHNNTLAPYFTCPNNKEAKNTLVSKIMSNWSKIYLAEALERLQPNVEGYQLTSQDLVSMQQLCAYETVSLGWSDFCGLFTKKEFQGFSYYSDLTFWYAYSFGSPSAAAIGKGWVQELVSRLSKTPISDYDSSTNSTLNSNPKTFPLDQPIYVDATHDTVISSIVVTLNLTSLAAEGPLPTRFIPKKQSFYSSQISPFAANLQTQVVECDGEEKIRFLLNDSPVPLTGLRGCKDDEQGFCSLSTTIESLNQRFKEIDYSYDCNHNYDYVPPIGGGGIVNGRPPV
ncbi:histidine phosphatase superfamily, partial [Phakopsora pachyrhizi]